jgi:hypothetical protein
MLKNLPHQVKASKLTRQSLVTCKPESGREQLGRPIKASPQNSRATRIIIIQRETPLARPLAPPHPR